MTILFRRRRARIAQLEAQVADLNRRFAEQIVAANKAGVEMLNGITEALVYR